MVRGVDGPGMHILDVLPESFAHVPGALSCPGHICGACPPGPAAGRQQGAPGAACSPPAVPPPCMSPLSGPAPGAGIEEQVARRVKQCERWRASKPPRFHARGSQIYRAPAAEEMTRDGA